VTKDRVFWLTCLSAAGSIVVLAALMLGYLIVDSWQAITTLGLGFFTNKDWDPVRNEYGALAFVYGTLVTSLAAMVIAVPLSVGSAAFLAEVAPRWLRKTGSFLIELLAAIPSVVYGFWGIFFLAPIIQQVFDKLGGPNHGGVGLTAASLILAIMIVPYIAAISFDVCRAVPRSQREASLALGATRWQTIWSVILPYARPGILGACFLALGRALGETMAVTMLIGNSPHIDLSPFGLGDSIASVIANQLNNTNNELQRAALVELGLVLLLVSIAVNVVARLLIWRVGKGLELSKFLRRRPGLINEAGNFDEKPQVVASRQRRNRLINVLMMGVLGGCLCCTIIPLFLILGFVTFRGVTSLNLAFFTNLPIDVPAGLGHALVGSAILVSLATLFAVPIGLLAAIYLNEYRTSKLAKVVRFIGELLGGVPSIIIGIFGYAVLVMPLGFSGWAGSFALGIMMIPIVLRSSEESLKLVPGSLRNGSYALGAAAWQTAVRVIVPAALPAIVTGIFLAIARIAGETAPLLLTANNSTFWPRSPSERMPYLTYYIYTYSRSDDLAENRLAWSAALVLLMFVMLLNIGIRSLTGRRAVLASRGD
jgi:phosphate transport system permease protein